MIDEKDCVVCKEIKPVLEFYKDSRMKCGFSSECKTCRRKRNGKWHTDNYETKERVVPKRYTKEFGHITEKEDYRRNNYLQQSYGISVTDYDRLYESQGGSCAICKKSLPSLFVDHCHQSDIVRGLLCMHCNFGLGHFVDSIENLENAIEYLKLKR